MWTEFSQASQQALTSIVERSVRDGRLEITIPRIQNLVVRLQTVEPGEISLMRQFGMSVALMRNPLTNYQPLTFLYEGPLAGYLPPLRN